MTEDTFPQTVAPGAGQQIDTSNLREPDGDYMKEFERIIQDQFGIKITNKSGHQIGFSTALPWKWRPVNGFRETLRGILKKYEVSTQDADKVYDSSTNNDKKYREDEYDWCLYLEPAETYREQFSSGVIACKVTPGKNFHDTEWFPFLEGKLNVEDADDDGIEADTVDWGLPSPLLEYDMCVYGPYVIVEEYDDDPHEIHPIDAIWWRENNNPLNNQLKVLLLQDAAKGRFREEGMFMKPSSGVDIPGWKPWIEYPQLEEIKIPFTYDPHNETYWHIMVEVNTAMDITLQDRGEGAQHQLLQAGSGNTPLLTPLPILVRVSEERNPDKRNIAVQFPLDELTRDAQGIIRGYVNLVAALGIGDSVNNNNHEGVLELTLTFKQESNKLVAHQ
jgi:hypothetical protein